MKHFIPAIGILALSLAFPFSASAEDHAAPPTAPQPTPMAISDARPVAVICSDSGDKHTALQPRQSPWDTCPGGKPLFIIFKPLPIIDHIPPASAQDDGGGH